MKNPEYPKSKATPAELAKARLFRSGKIVLRIQPSDFRMIDPPRKARPWPEHLK